MMNTTDFLAHLTYLNNTKDIEAASFLLFDYVDQLACQKSWHRIDEIIRFITTNVHYLDTNILRGILSITNPFRDELSIPDRECLRAVIWDRFIEEKGYKKAEQLLGRL